MMVCMISFDEDDEWRGNMNFSATTAVFWAGTFIPNEQEPGKKWYTVMVSPFEHFEMCRGQANGTAVTTPATRNVSSFAMTTSVRSILPTENLERPPLRL